MLQDEKNIYHPSKKYSSADFLEDLVPARRWPVVAQTNSRRGSNNTKCGNISALHLPWPSVGQCWRKFVFHWLKLRSSSIDSRTLTPPHPHLGHLIFHKSLKCVQLNTQLLSQSRSLCQTFNELEHGHGHVPWQHDEMKTWTRQSDSEWEMLAILRFV